MTLCPRRFVLGLLFAFIPFLVVGRLNAQTCLPLTADLRSNVAAYVVERYEVAPDLRVDDEGLAGGSCFRRLTIRVSVPNRSLALFLSPDQRFVTETLMDLNVSPAAERRRAAHETEAALLADESPSLGPDRAKVTLVVFSDFECPFCRRFQETLAGVAAKDLLNDRVVFKHRPLTMHPWARRAALNSICVGRQSGDAFWRLHDFFFSNQSAITAGNLEEKIGEFAKQFKGIDSDRVRACVAEEDTETTLRRDEKLAVAYHIDAIPTVFINGVRSVGTHSTEELTALFRAAAGELPR